MLMLYAQFKYGEWEQIAGVLWESYRDDSFGKFIFFSFTLCRNKDKVLDEETIIALVVSVLPVSVHTETNVNLGTVQT